MPQKPSNSGFSSSNSAVGQQAQIDLGLKDVPAAKREYAAEVSYGWQAAPWLTVRPNIQWIRHPGGREDRPSMVVAGLKTIWVL